MKVTLLAVVALTAVTLAIVDAVDPECLYRKIRNLSPHWPNPSSCSSFYRCSSKNVVRRVNCPAGKEYNPKTGKCANAGRGLCNLSLVAPLAETTNVCADEVTGAYLANTENCAGFYICDEQKAYAQKCPLGSFFNNTASACEPDTAKTCWSNFCIDKEDGQAVADATDCTVFYLCYGGAATLQKCPEGSRIDVTGWICVPGTCEDTSTEPCEDSTTTTPEPCEEETTTEIPEGCDCEKAKNGELDADPDNCRRFLVCLNGVLEEGGDCGTGNRFDAELRVCVPDTDNQCCVSAACTNGDVKVDPQDCTKFDKCVDGEWVSNCCSSGEYFNGVQCETDTDNVCIDGSTTIASTTSTTEIPASTDESTTSAAIPTSTTTTELTTFAFIAECSARDLPAIGKNCWSYSVCMNGQWQQETCSKDFYFDAATGICRQDTANVCPENRSKGSKSASRQKRSLTCPGGIEQGAIICHPTDCDKYQICENGELVEGSCGVGNVLKGGVCVPDTAGTCWPCANKPNGYQMANPADCTSYITCWNGLATDTSCGSGQWYSIKGACEVDVTGQCINPCTCSTGDVAHPICTKYYQCTDGVPTVLQCPAGEAFDSETSECSSTVACSAKLCATAADDTTYPVEDDTSKFYLCKNKEATIVACPSESAYEALLGICKSQPSANCDQTICKDAAEDYTYPSLSTDTSTFCICQDGEGYLESCGSGLFFNSTTGACDFTGNCDPRVCDSASEYSVSQDYEDPDNFCLCRAGEPVSVPCPIGYTFDAEDLLCTAIKIPDPRCCSKGCLDKPDFTNIAAVNTDEGFCVCVDEVPTFQSCEPNTAFNASIGACISSTSVSCTPNACDASQCDDGLNYNTFGVENDTSAFCYCQSSCPVLAKCAEGSEFNPDLGMCQVVVVTPKECDADQCDTLNNFATYPAVCGVAGFCVCEDGLPSYVLCDEGTEFNAKLGLCKAPQDSSVTAECSAAKCATQPDLVPFPTNTGGDNNPNFCICENGDVFLETCDADMVYSASAERCVVLAASECVCEPGKCSEDYWIYPALNTSTGFCTCLDETPVFKSCDEGQTFNSAVGACMEASALISATSACDSVRCRDRTLGAQAFAALNTTGGYCTCQDVDTAIFFHCDSGKLFDISKGICTLSAMIQCNLQECQKRSRFEAFASASTRTGFCSCDDEDRISVTFHPCSVGQLFAPELGLCTNYHGVQKRSVEAEENVCDLDEKRPVETNCSQYEVCIDGQWRRRTCSDQRYYNTEQQRCLEPRDDFVCSFARVSNLPLCSNVSESQTVPAKSGICQQYFRCFGGKWRLRNCAKQYYYSPQAGTCLPMPKDQKLEPNQTICSWMMTRTSVNLTEDCQQLAVRPSKAGGCQSYLMCLDNAWWLHQCPLGMYFSREHNYCLPNDKGQCLIKDDKAICSAGDSRALVGSCHSYELCQEGQWIKQRCQEREQFEPLLGCIPSDGSCQANGMRRICREGELRSKTEEDNCSPGFLFCEDEEWHLGSCLRGHSYAAKQNSCMVQSQCQVKRLLSAENKCLGQLDGLSVPDPTDCTQFYLCLQQEAALLQSCPSGSFYDSESGYCRPNDGSCQLAICSNVEDGKLVAHPEDCRAYYSCSKRNGTSLIRCDEGQYFHSFLSMCRVDHGQCVKETNQNDTDQTTKMCSGLHGVRVPHELYCNLYYACVKGLAIPVECPAQHQFNPVLSLCEPESQAIETCRNGQLESNSSHAYSCGNLADGTFLANRTDCTRYFICAGGVAMAQRCDAGRYFDSEQLLCLVDDGSCPLVESVGDDDEPNNQHIPPDPLVCEGKHGHIMPDPANCNNFYICVSGTLRHELCYTGYFFNSTLQQCQAYEVNSGADSTSEQPIESQSGDLGSQERAGSSLGICKDKPTSFDTICGIIGSSFVAEQGDCRRYTSCEDDLAISQRCRNGESFDSLLGICRQSDGTCLMENGERVGVCTGKHGQLTRDADNCRGYFVCVHGQKIEGQCAQGEFFNRLTSSCEPDTLQQCKTEGDDTVAGDNIG
ncbi:chitin-binding domain protein cbd-1 [Drosophila bipectinata]|uniref:chitin-binding domain protein cbd-1 n=1 Tax=Drosophila bipectinata TaxID=42026 RepID=UPI001C8951A8|nr:uncharacterized protein LOC108122378 [Drosophila bipectinata]